jgi:hypothetical protein
MAALEADRVGGINLGSGFRSISIPRAIADVMGATKVVRDDSACARRNEVERLCASSGRQSAKWAGAGSPAWMASRGLAQTADWFGILAIWRGTGGG